MKKFKLFDRNLYIEALRQLRTIGVVSGVIFLLQSIFVPLFFYVKMDEQGIIQGDIFELNILAAAPLLMVIAILMPIMANILFSFINQRNASDFYHALPVRRETMYITYLAAILSWCLTLFVVPALLEFLLFLPMSFVKLDMSMSGYMFADTMVIGLLLTSAVLIAKCVTGTRFGIFAVMCMILFLPRLYLLYIREMVELIHSPLVVLYEGHNIFWDQNWNLMFGIFESGDELRSVIYTLVLSAAYLIIAGVLFVKRKSEKAESVSISSRWQLVFRVLPALTFSMLPIYFILALIYAKENMTGEFFTVLIIQYIVVIVIYFLYELITTRKLHSVVKAAPGLLVLAAANIAMILFIKCYGDYQAQICPAAEDITSIRFAESGDLYYTDNVLFWGYYYELLKDIEFQNDEINEVIVEQLKKTQDENSPYKFQHMLCVEIQYNGRSIYRRIGFESSDPLVKAIMDDERFFRFSDVFPVYDVKTCKLRVHAADSEHFTDAQMIKIYNQALEELALLDNAVQYSLVFDNQGLDERIYITFNHNDHGSNHSHQICLAIDPKLMPETWKLIQKYSGNGNPD